MVLVELEAANEAEFGHTDARIVELSVVVTALWPEWHQQRNYQRALTLLDNQHALADITISVAICHSAATSHSSELVPSAEPKAIQVQIVERLADVVEVESCLALCKHF